MELVAKYMGTVTKPVRTEVEVDIPCAEHHNPKIVHHYHKNEITGVSPTYHHYTFGKVGSPISGGFYVKVGDEIPEFLELHASEITVTLPDVRLTLKPVKGDD